CLPRSGVESLRERGEAPPCGKGGLRKACLPSMPAASRKRHNRHHVVSELRSEEHLRLPVLQTTGSAGTRPYKSPSGIRRFSPSHPALRKHPPPAPRDRNPRTG